MDYTAIIEGTVKFRDGKKWKSRWCVVRKISPVADCLHLQLYRDSKDRYKQGQTKASLSLQHFLGVETGFTLDKESNTIAILCQDVTVVLAFDTRERLIQWQVKIANNLGEDQQYLIQVGAAPPKAKIAPGPARLHVQEYRFSLTMGVPPRLIGVWNISQLRKYGVVENRFVFEGGSGCGRYEGVYVLVTDQGEEISHAFKAASQGKLIPKRKQVSRNMSVALTNSLAVIESPRKLQARMKSVAASEMECCRQDTLWESSETPQGSEFGDTVSVSDLAIEPQDNWNPQDLSRCRGCMTKIGSMTRSLTVSNTPGTGFNPAWIMESKSCEHHITRNTICCNISVISHTCHSGSNSSKSTSDDSGCRSGAISPCSMNPICSHQIEPKTPLVQPKQAHPDPPAPYENYDTPRSLCINLKDEQSIGNRNSVASSGSELEYYDTPKKLKESIIGPCQACNMRCTSPPPACHQPLQKLDCSCHAVIVCPCQKVHCQPKPIMICSCCSQDIKFPQSQVHHHDACANGAIYAKVDLLKKTKRRLESSASVPPPSNSAMLDLDMSRENISQNYANLQFAQSLSHYENVRDLRVHLDSSGLCTKCQCAQKQEESTGNEDYLLMGPIADDENKSSIDKVSSPPYIPMNPIRNKCPCSPFNEPLSSETRSATASPFLRRHDPTSCYLNEERRRMAQIRRRSNSMDSGRFVDGLECITERTVSSQNTLTANSNTNSVDSLPSEKAEVPPKPITIGKIRQAPSRRSSSGPVSKSNRDSSSSNDSGVSTGSLKNFGAGFLEFETILTPLSKVRTQSLGGVRRELTKSKSSDPLEELTFRFNKADIKSSSAEAEVPICPPKKESKDLSVSSSSGALTIPYVDSISTSSGASDMSDYIETLSMSSFSSSEHDNLRQCHSAVTVLRPRSGKEYQKIDRINIDEGKHKLSMQHIDSPSPGYGSSTSSN